MSREEINGVKVIVRQRARIATPISKDVPVEHKEIDECLMEDGTTLFQCASEHEECDYVSDNPVSVRSHMTRHGGKARARRAESNAVALLERTQALEAELEERKRRRSAGSKAGAVTRAARKAQAQAQAQANGHVTDVPTPLVQPTSPNADVKVIAHAIEVAIDDLQEINETAVRLRTMLTTSLHQLARLEPMTVDPMIAEKAAAFDQMQKLLGKK